MVAKYGGGGGEFHLLLYLISSVLNGMVRDFFLLAYAYLGRYPGLISVEPLALKPDLIECNQPGIRHEP